MIQVMWAHWGPWPGEEILATRAANAVRDGATTAGVDRGEVVLAILVDTITVESCKLVPKADVEQWLEVAGIKVERRLP